MVGLINISKISGLLSLRKRWGLVIKELGCREDDVFGSGHADFEMPARCPCGSKVGGSGEWC